MRYPKEVRLIDARADAGKRSYTLRHGSGPRRRRKARQGSDALPAGGNFVATSQQCSLSLAEQISSPGGEKLGGWPSGKMPFAFRWNVRCNRIYFVMLPGP